MNRPLFCVLVGSLLVLVACSKPEPTPHDYAKSLPRAISESIDEVVSDPARAQAAKHSATRFEYAIRAYNEEAWKIRGQAFYLNANYGTTLERFESFLVELQELRSQKQAQVIQNALEARESMSKEEWQAFHEVLAERLEQD